MVKASKEGTDKEMTTLERWESTSENELQLHVSTDNNWTTSQVGKWGTESTLCGDAKMLK